MNNPVHILGLVAAAGLSGATAVAFWGRRRYRNDLWANIWDRMVGWWQIVAVLGVALWAGRAATLALFGIVSELALREFITIAPTARPDYRTLVWMFYVAIPLQYLLLGLEWYGLFIVFVPVYGFLLLSARNAAAYGTGDPAGFLARTSAIFWGQMLCIYCVSHIPAFLTLTVPGTSGLRLLLFVILVTQLSDVAQYIWGKTCGRRKVAPGISPNKTVEGMVGGIATITLTSPGLCFMTGLSWRWTMGLTLVATMLGFYGGLVMSAIKRDRRIKDWGNVIQGHGGVLDRIDSLVFAAPVVFHLVRYYLV